MVFPKESPRAASSGPTDQVTIWNWPPRDWSRTPVGLRRIPANGNQGSTRIDPLVTRQAPHLSHRGIARHDSTPPSRPKRTREGDDGKTRRLPMGSSLRAEAPRGGTRKKEVEMQPHKQTNHGVEKNIVHIKARDNYM